MSVCVLLIATGIIMLLAPKSAPAGEGEGDSKS